MSKRTDVLFAVKDLVALALPGATVLGLDGDESPPASIPETGLAIVRSGDPGDPEVDLGPVTYWYAHRIPVGVATKRSGGRTSEECLDDMLTAIGAGIEADRYLGGLCIWLEATAPGTEDLPAFDRNVVAGRPPRAGEIVIVARYGTTSPLA